MNCLRLCACIPLLISSWVLAAPDSDALIVHVLNRTGFGPAPGQIATVREMGVDQYLASQLAPAQIPLPPALNQQLQDINHYMPTPSELANFQRPARRGEKPDPQEKQAQRRQLYTESVIGLSTEHLLRAAHSPRQLEEVMVDFWFNHFNVYAHKGQVAVYLADYERNAIRPYVLGNFRDLLGATAHHPAMLFYLDNWQSAAPGYTPPGQGNAKIKIDGLNENYARELMELHTLGVDGGYTQQDVTELARMLTGWTFDPTGRRASYGEFWFDSSRHDGGNKQWLGQTIQNQGQREGEKALDQLAASPATARHIAYKLAQYFVADEPPADLVKRLAQKFSDAHGDIRATLAYLLASKEFRDPANYGQKFKTPYRYVVSSLRAGDVPFTNARPLMGAMAKLGQPLYGCQTPDGYKAVESAWLSPDALSQRIGFATALAVGRLPLMKPLDRSQPSEQNASEAEAAESSSFRGEALDATALFATLGNSISSNTHAKIDAQPDKLKAALILGSPDFMRY